MGYAMDFTHYALGQMTGGSIIEVTLVGSAANVRLLDSSNFQNYRRGRQCRFIGGLATRSPVSFEVPHTGQWHLTVDMLGLRGSVRSAIRTFLASD